MINKCMKYYTYIYFDPSRNNEPIYVGKGSGKRNLYHLTRKKIRHPFIQRLEYMKELNIEPIIQAIYGLDEVCAYELEMEFISFFGRKDLNKGPLLNLTDGGGRNTGSVLSEGHRRRIGEKSKGRIKTPETRKKLSISVSSFLQENKRIWNEETKEKISKSLQGRPHTEERKENLRKAWIKRKEKQRLTASIDSDIIQSLGRQTPA